MSQRRRAAATAALTTSALVMFASGSACDDDVMTANPADPSTEPTPTPDWKPILAALGNEAARTVFAQASLGGLDASALADLNSRQVQALQRWLELDVLQQEADGSVTVNAATLRATLAAPEARGAVTVRDGVGKYLAHRGTGPRISVMPTAPQERLALLTWVRDGALEPGELLSEAQLNQRLRVFHPDVALLRRYLVDHGLLERTRTGTEYAIPAGQGPDRR